MEQQMKITWPTVTDTGKGSSDNFLILFTYYNNRFTQYYLNVPKDEAIKRFTTSMNQRHPFEIKQEGWDATGIIIPFSSTNEAWLGRGNLFEGMNEYFTDLFLQNNK